MRLFFFVAGAFVAGIVLAAPAPQQPPPARAVDLKVADGTVLKATYFAAAKPGPGVLLFHQSNRTRKEWVGVAGSLAAVGIHTPTVDSVLPVSPLGPDRRTARRALLGRRFSPPDSRLALLQRSRIQLVVSLLKNDFLA